MSIFVWAIELIWYIVSTMLIGVMNTKLYEYGEGVDYIVFRVYHFFFVGFAFLVIFFVLRSFFRRGGES